MIIDIGTGVDESVVKWKYNDKDKWRDADIDELIHLYESVVYCKDCRHGQYDATHYFCAEHHHKVYEDDFCSYGERSDEVNGFKSVGQAWNTSQERR